MKLWATRDKSNSLQVIELWIDKPVCLNGYWDTSDEGGSLLYMSITLFKLTYKRLPRCDRPMRVTLTGRVTK